MLRATHYGRLALGIFVLTVYGSLIPFRFQPQPLVSALAAFRQISLSDPWDLYFRGDWVVSVGLFAALSYLLMGALCVDRGRQVGLTASLATVAFCAALSVVIEFVQIYFPPRTVSLNDVMVETLGGVTGTLVWLAGGQRITNWVRRLETSTGLASLARRLFPGYFALLLIVQLMPFDFVVSTAELAVKYQEDKIGLLPFARYPLDDATEWLGKMLVHGGLFFPLGFLKALAREGRGSRPGHPVLLFALGLTSLVELLKLFVYSRVFDTTSILTGTAAIWLGWQVGQAWRDRARTVRSRSLGLFTMTGPMPVFSSGAAALLFAGWLGALLYVNWRPFDFTTDPARFASAFEELPLHGLRRMSWLPLVEYYWGSKYEALDQFLRKAVSFLPLGVLAGLQLSRLYTPWVSGRVIITALLAGVLVEAGRYFLPSRVPSVTDALIGCFGAWLGFILTRHVRTVLWAESTLYGWATVVRG
jgi:VanZ family protein